MCIRDRVGLVPYNPAKADAPYPVLFARMREDLKAIDALAAETGDVYKRQTLPCASPRPSV